MNESEQVGTALRDAREAARLSVTDAATRLLISPLQIRSLESGSAEGFYGERFRERALEKYARLLGVRLAGPTIGTAPEEGSGSAAETIEIAPPESAEAFADEEPPERDAPVLASSTPAPARFSRVWVLAGLLVAVTVAAAIWYPPAPSERLAEATTPADAAANGPSATTEVEAPTAETVAENAVAAETSPAPVAPPVAAAAPPTVVTVRANGLCWVFARDANGKETERTLRAGDEIRLPIELQYLAIGDTGSAVLLLGERAVDLAPWTNANRTARLSRQALETLGLPT